MTAPDIRYIVLNENTLGLTRASTPNMMEVLASSLIRGGYHWANGSICLSPRDNVRPATVVDFAEYRVSPKGHLPDPEPLSSDH